MSNETKGNWWIWKVFWILLAITTVEVVLGMIKPDFLMGQFLGTKLINHIFIILTIVKAAYIVLHFMHLGHETKGLRWTILIPVLVLIPYLLALVLIEGQYMYIIR